MKKTQYLVLMFLVLPAVYQHALAQTSTTSHINYPEVLHVGLFSSYDSDTKRLPDGWQTMTFRGIRNTEYKLVRIDEITSIQAIADNSSSGLIYENFIDLNEFPIIEWSWRVENILQNGDVTSKSGDDYAARIYVIFDYDLQNLSWGQRNLIRALRTFYGKVPARAINYIHASHADVGLVVPNPYTELVTMVVVDSGEQNVGTWQTFRRNIYDDYVAIYGEKPPKIGGLAIMTDSDDTGEKAVAYFGDIRFLRTIVD
jgi:hypothetical protein